jgi:hypothetical protein
MEKQKVLCVGLNMAVDGKSVIFTPKWRDQGVILVFSIKR